MLRKHSAWLGALCLGFMLAGCGASPPGGANSGSGATTGSGATSSDEVSGPPGSPDIPRLPADTSKATPVESLPWTLTGVDRNLNRVYLSAQVRACNEPIRVRFAESSASIVVTLVGQSVPVDTVCPLHVTIETGYVQIPDAIGSRSIEHAAVTAAK